MWFRFFVQSCFGTVGRAGQIWRDVYAGCVYSTFDFACGGYQNEHRSLGYKSWATVETHISVLSKRGQATIKKFQVLLLSKG